MSRKQQALTWGGRRRTDKNLDWAWSCCPRRVPCSRGQEASLPSGESMRAAGQRQAHKVLMQKGSTSWVGGGADRAPPGPQSPLNTGRGGLCGGRAARVLGLGLQGQEAGFNSLLMRRARP